MTIWAGGGGVVFVLGNPVPGAGGGLDLQEIRVGGGGESSHPSEARMADRPSHKYPDIFFEIFRSFRDT